MRNSAVLTVVVMSALFAVAGFAALKAGATGAGNKQQALAKEESLSVTASAAQIDLRQPQHIETATFALG